MRLPLERHARRTAMARETRQCLRDFNRLNNATQRRASSTTECWKSIPIASTRARSGAQQPPRSSHEAYSYAHERLLVEGGGPIAGGTVGECCEDFMTSTNTYDPKGRL